MSRRSRVKHKGRSDTPPFVMLRRDIMRYENFKTMGGNPTKLLIDLLSQYNGRNNGDLCAAWTLMKERGWNSKGTLHRSLKELLQRGWIVKSRQGGKHKASLYAITWLPIDECDGKLDIAPTITPINSWRDTGEIENAAPHEDHIDPVVVPIKKNLEGKVT